MCNVVICPYYRLYVFIKLLHPRTLDNSSFDKTMFPKGPAPSPQPLAKHNPAGSWYSRTQSGESRPQIRMQIGVVTRKAMFLTKPNKI